MDQWDIHTVQCPDSFLWHDSARYPINECIKQCTQTTYCTYTHLDENRKRV